ncbi:MAG TPA: M20/M25/M40 family metallo-hydrolase, partial [Agromyces sp.]|nr:M20/M25/M40 family metallo-hydrolase [Agromyces sp.]
MSLAARRPPLDLTADPVAITQAICDVPSVSGEEAALADLIVEALAGAEHLEIVRDGDTVVARTHLGRDRRVVIAGHLDTVPINGNLPTRFETIDGEAFLWGRGTVDMKAGVAVQLKLALELVSPIVDLTWMWYDNEEVAASLNGLGRIAHTQPHLFAGDFAILGEPSNGQVEGGCNGTLRAE